MELLKAFIIDRLTVAADEIFGAVEKVVKEYQEDVDRSKKENARFQRLDLVLKAEIKREPHSHGFEAEVSPGQQLCEQECRIRLGQENPETSLVMEEQEELWATQLEEQLPGLASDTEDFILTAPCVRTDLDQVLPQPAHLYSTQTVENSERTPWDSQLASAAQIKTEPNREGYAGPGSTSDSLLLSVVNPPETTDSVESSGLLQFVLKPLYPSITESLSIQGKQFQCKECGKRFNCKGILNRHLMIHTGAKPFKCKECGKCFNRKSALNRHIMVHTGAKPFKCKECDKCFNRECHLNRHMRIHTRGKTGSLALPDQLANAVESGSSPFIFDFPEVLSTGTDQNAPGAMGQTYNQSEQQNMYQTCRITDKWL